MLMTMKMITAAALGAALTFVVGTAVAQNRPETQPSALPKVNCNGKNATDTVSGQITRIDPGSNTLTIRDNSGAMHDFQASSETLRDLKAGDRIEARLRPAQNC